MGLDNFDDKNIVLTLGMFDGVHIAHSRILKECAEKAREYNTKSVCITYDPHPLEVLGKGKQVKLLTTIDEKIGLIKGCGIDILVIIKFTKEFADLSALDFITEINNKTAPREIIVGYRTTFGKERSGNAGFLRDFCEEHNIKLSVVEHISSDNETISSSHIRALIKEGKIAEANDLLGRAYSVKGKVIHGDARGRALGFNTANIQVGDENKLLPLSGVYGAKVMIDDKKYKGILSTGERPTFGRDFSIEVHIFDFADDIYGKEITCYFIDFLRGIIKFDTKEELIAQIKQDISSIFLKKD